MSIRSPWRGLAELAGLALVIAVSACSDSHGDSCVPGRQIACTCTDGDDGAQVCRSNNRYGPCVCEGRADDPDFGEDEEDPSSDDDGVDTTVVTVGGRDASTSVRDAGLDAGSRDAAVDAGSRGTGRDGGASIANAVRLSGASLKLIDVFVAKDRVWIVDIEGVSQRSLVDGAETHHWTAPRPLQAAAFDGMYLVATDGAKLTTLKADDLQLVAEGLLVEACASAVLLSKSRLICGPANDWDRILYTYDAVTATLLASSKAYTYNGIPMRPVPGMDAFVTVTLNLSPSDFHLYRLGQDNVVVFQNESPYHGDFAANNVYAFDADPPTHLINSQGLLLRFTADCGAGGIMTTPAANSCFLKDGALGTLTGGQQFVGMDNVGTTLAALIDPRGSSAFPGSTSDAGLVLQTIDVPQRTILSQQIVQLSGARALSLRSAPDQKAVVVAVSSGSSSSFPSDAATNYDVFRIDIAGP